MPNLAGINSTGRISFRLPRRQESIWQKSMASAWKSTFEQHTVHAVYETLAVIDAGVRVRGPEGIPPDYQP